MQTLQSLWRSPLVRVGVLVATLALALILTTQPGANPLVRGFKSLFTASVWRGVVGHTGLMFGLTLAIFFGLTMRLHWRFALLLTIGSVLVIGTLTEMYQNGVVGRDYSLADLLSNWLGVFMAATLILLIIAWRLPQKATA
jgi:Flp pilus assembly pilin Flp